MNQVLEKLTLIPLIVGSFLIILAFLEPNFWLLTIALFLMLASVGAIMPNTGALALDNQKNNSGSASALLGTIQFFISAISSFLVGYFNDGSIMPICLIFGICAILAFLVFGLEKKFVIRKF
jgi:DHA1 family bicyclomycin/chloramphenicol resistance-like MFS transporter